MLRILRATPPLRRADPSLVARRFVVRFRAASNAALSTVPKWDKSKLRRNWRQASTVPFRLPRTADALTARRAVKSWIVLRNFLSGIEGSSDFNRSRSRLRGQTEQFGPPVVKRRPRHSAFRLRLINSVVDW